MSDRDALYAAILANPDEDTPRMMYADWLEENGQAKSAKYIRVACELARLDEEDPSLATFPDEAPSFWQDIEPQVARRVTLAAVAAPREYVKAELARLPKLKGVSTGNAVGSGSPVRRGFVERAAFKSAADFVRHADAVFRAAPIREVVLDDPTSGNLDQVAASRWFRQIHCLTLGTGVYRRTWEFELRALSDSGSVENLRSLTIGDADPDCLRVLAADRAWGGLRQLSVRRWEDDDDAPNADEQIAELFNAKHLRKLTSLELDRVQIGSIEAHKAISAARMPDLRSLAFRCEGSGFGEALAIAKHMPKLRSLAVTNSYLEGSEIAKIVCSPSLRNLAVLDVTGNWIKKFGKGDFQSAECESLRHLAISSHYDRVTAAWEPLFKWVARSGLISFALGHDGVSNSKPDSRGLKALMKCGEFPNLKRIALRKPMVTGAIKKHFGARVRVWTDE